MAGSVLDQLDTYGPSHCPPMTHEQAVAYSRGLARTHYENFTVVSWLLPARLRDDFRNIYAFCRWADDLGDETGDPARSLSLLAWWRQELDLCYQGKPRHPVFIALTPTIERHDIPRQPFDDLISAFEQDQRVNRYATWEQLIDYCTRSANPVGRLVLYLCGYRDAQRQALSDATCTALQLTNFWQDVRRDIIERGRVYLPEDAARLHGLDIDDLVKIVRIDHQASCEHTVGCKACQQITSGGMGAIASPYRATIRAVCRRTWPLFEEGRKLLPTLSRDVRMDVTLFTLGGEAILKKIERRNYDTLTHRPTLGKAARLMLLMRAMAGRLRA